MTASENGSPRYRKPPTFSQYGLRFQADYGGAINSTGVIEASGTQFKGNTAIKGGGGVYIDSASTDKSVFTGCTFEQNKVGEVSNAQAFVKRGDGGGIRVARGAVTITGTTFTQNAAERGSGLSIGVNGAAEVKTCKFEYNEASTTTKLSYEGRAIDIEAGNNTWVTIQGTTFDHNGIRGVWVDNGSNTFIDSPNE